MKAILGFFLKIYVALFRMSKGRIGGKMAGMDVLLLHTIGRKSGKSRIAPVGYMIDNGDFVIIASAGGARKNPGWYHNLKANPDATIELKGRQEIGVHAEEAEGENRERLWNQVVARSPAYGKYPAKVERTIPVMILRPQ